MNRFLLIQVQNMVAVAETFKKSCEFAAIQDDGIIDKQEEIMIRRIDDATKKYLSELKSITADN